MKKIPLIAGNWKMNKSNSEAIKFIETLSQRIDSFKGLIYLAVPFTCIQEAAKVSDKIIIGAQNMNDAQKGAFTGEIAALMLKEVGAKFVILGHSERRQLFHESDEFIHKKVLRAIKDGLQPILCIGETLQEREEQMTEDVLKSQLQKALKDLSNEDLFNLIIAYEPIWAIGTGKSATANIAQEAHLFIRNTLTNLFDENVAQKIYILYGGSVNADNINSLMQEPDIDGVLVGGASLEVESFLKIIKNLG